MGLTQIYLPLLSALFQLGAGALWGVNSSRLVEEVLTEPRAKRLVEEASAFQMNGGAGLDAGYTKQTVSPVPTKAVCSFRVKGSSVH